MTAVIVVAVALLIGIGLVVSQLARLREWLGKAPPEPPAETPDTPPSPPGG